MELINASIQKASEQHKSPCYADETTIQNIPNSIDTEGTDTPADSDNTGKENDKRNVSVSDKIIIIPSPTDNNCQFKRKLSTDHDNYAEGGTRKSARLAQTTDDPDHPRATNADEQPLVRLGLEFLVDYDSNSSVTSKTITIMGRAGGLGIPSRSINICVHCGEGFTYKTELKSHLRYCWTN